MDFPKGKARTRAELKISPLGIMLVLLFIVLAAFNPDATKHLYGRLHDLVSGQAGTSDENPSQPAATPVSDAQARTQTAVEAYMHRYAPPQATLSFLDWSDFSSSPQGSAITLTYRVQRPARQDVLATVRFTLQAGAVLKAEVAQPGLQAANLPPARPRPPARPVQVIDHFSGPRFAAMHGPSMTLHLNDAFSLAQLDQAKQRAQSERKPLGFLMVWGQFFEVESDPHSDDSVSALVHFYEVFNQQLVLVFVRHETELNSVPVAVMRGFRGANEGGYAPNMAVTDATATEFIVEIPYKRLDGAGRDQLFAAGGRKIDEWLATHPNAMPTPPE